MPFWGLRCTRIVRTGESLRPTSVTRRPARLGDASADAFVSGDFEWSDIPNGNAYTPSNGGPKALPSVFLSLRIADAP